MSELLNPKGQPVWQLNKPIFEMTTQERYEALGYIESLIEGGVRDLQLIERCERLKKKVSFPRKNKVRAEQIPLFDIPLKRVRRA